MIPWAGRTRLLAVYDGADNLKMRFEYADGRLPYAVTTGGSVYCLAYDQVGSLRAVAAPSGTVIKEVICDTFGSVLSDTNPAFALPFGFAGDLHDRDTGLVRFGYRDYDPAIGRWTAKDPIGFAGGDTDLYGYCLNDPVNWMDPLGLSLADIIPGIRKAPSEGTKGGAYATGEAARSTAGIAMHGHPLAQTALSIAFVSMTAPMAGATVITVWPSATLAMYYTTPYSGAVVDFAYGWFAETGPPKGWGYVNSGAKYIFEMIRNIILQTKSDPC